jgi:hypothetical protein
MSAAAIIAMRRRKFVRQFREQGATSADRAIPFAFVGMRRSWVFDQMVSQGVFVPVGEDRFYMNEQLAEAFLAAKRRQALIGAAILLALFFIVLAATKLR